MKTNDCQDLVKITRKVMISYVSCVTISCQYQQHAYALVSILFKHPLAHKSNKCGNYDKHKLRQKYSKRQMLSLKYDTFIEHWTVNVWLHDCVDSSSCIIAGWVRKGSVCLFIGYNLELHRFHPSYYLLYVCTDNAPFHTLEGQHHLMLWSKRLFLGNRYKHVT